MYLQESKEMVESIRTGSNGWSIDVVDDLESMIYLVERMICNS